MCADVLVRINDLYLQHFDEEGDALTDLSKYHEGFGAEENIHKTLMDPNFRFITCRKDIY
jgi:hypothetical protein